MSQPTFSQAIKQYISMALKLWPLMQLSIENLEDAVQPPNGSPIPRRNYRQMNQQQFLNTLTDDLFDYIQEHDVKADHLVDYLDDIAAILNTQEQSKKTVEHMAGQLVLLIQEVPEGKYERLIYFRHVYEALHGKVQHQIQDRMKQAEGSDYDEEYDNYEDVEEDQEQGNQGTEQDNQKKNEDEVPKLTEIEKKELEDDGWTVVTKKGKK